MFRLLKRISVIVLLFLIMVGSAFYISDAIKYNHMKEVILEEYEGFSFYSEEIQTMPYEKEEILALENLEYHSFNKKQAVESPWVNQKHIDLFNQQEVKETRVVISQLSGEIYDMYIFKAFIRYINSTNGIVLILIVVEIIRFLLEEKRRGKRHA